MSNNLDPEVIESHGKLQGSLAFIKPLIKMEIVPVDSGAIRPACSISSR